MHCACCSDPLSRAPPEMPFCQAIQPGVLPLPAKVAWSPDLGIAPVDPEVVSICEKAAAWFASLGAEVINDCPDVHDAVHIFQVRPSSIAHAVCTAIGAPACHMHTQSLRFPCSDQCHVQCCRSMSSCDAPSQRQHAAVLTCQQCRRHCLALCSNSSLADTSASNDEPAKEC